MSQNVNTGRNYGSGGSVIEEHLSLIEKIKVYAWLYIVYLGCILYSKIKLKSKKNIIGSFCTTLVRTSKSSWPYLILQLLLQ